jgi:glutamine synthetase
MQQKVVHMAAPKDSVACIDQMVAKGPAALLHYIDSRCATEHCLDGRLMGMPIQDSAQHGMHVHMLIKDREVGHKPLHSR